MELRVAGIAKESIVDGPGIRLVIFTQGCPHRCRGCHNPQTHDLAGGDVVDTDYLLSLAGRAKLIRGVTFSGGEPFLQPAPLAQLGRQIKALGLNIVTYTGYLYEELVALGRSDKAVKELLTCTDILVDGPFRMEERDISLAFRGSRNQRLIDIPKSVAAGKVVQWEDPNADFRLRA